MNLDVTTHSGYRDLRTALWTRLSGKSWRPASLVIIIILFVLVISTFRDYGITWDEQVQDIYGHDVLSYYLSFFRDRSAFNFINLRYYGGLFDLLAALVNGISPFGEYETRHLLGGLIGIAGALGAYRLTHLLAGERAAFIALLLLALTPLLYGHSFINPKDAPFAWAMIWATFYACRAVGELPKPSRATVVGFGIALGLGLATRIGTVIVLPFLLIALALYGARRWAETHKVGQPVRESLFAIVTILPALPIAYLLMAVFWPWSVQAPLNPLKAMALFSHFPFDGQVLWNGHEFSAQHLPAGYLPLLLLFQLPETVLLGLLLCLVAGVGVLRRKGIVALTRPQGLRYAVLLQAAFLPVLAAVIFRPVAYNGMRHFLFVIPPLIVLAAIGLDHLLDWFQQRNRHAALAVAALLAIVSAWQATIMVELHPDEYVYYNGLVGGVAGAAGRFDLDYWGDSLAEASRDLAAYVSKLGPPQSAKVWRAAVCGDWLSSAYFLPKNIEYTGSEANADFYIALNSADCNREAKGRIIVEVRRAGSLLSYVRDLRANRLS
jgi:4-amino-4-deoxy-L-arabinose transferase-like glycosyltransferase